VNTRKRSRKVMEELGIESLARASIYDLSPGQAHLVAIVRALAVEYSPPDEPFAYLNRGRNRCS